MSRLASFESGPDQSRWALPIVRFARPSRAGRHPQRATAISLAPRFADKAGQVAAYAVSGAVYIGVLVAVFWV